ncbi:MAG: DUF4115 domain-containing protein [Paracoccaceae bacterium]|nr:DUF4115 domain-containing protein [Paracoccaceae bacterium]
MIGRSNPPPVEKPLKPKGFDDYELRLGDIMRGERATMGKSLLDVQRDLKIKATYIAAIENADPSGFETQGFIAGYVRSYARYLGLDPEWAYQRFCNEANFATMHGMSPAASPRVGPEQIARKVKKSDPLEKPNVSFTPPQEAFWNRIEPGAIGSSLVLLMLTSAIGFGGWSVFQEIQQVELTPVDQAPGVVASVAPLDSRAAVFEDEEDYAGFTSTRMDALDRLYKPQVLDLPVMVARDGPIATLNPSNMGTLAPVPEPETAGPQMASADQLATTVPVQVVGELPAQVELLAARPSWVRVTSADGTVLFEKILDAGERYLLPATEEPPMLRAGNAGSLYFLFNGNTYGPAGQGQSVVKDVPLSVENVSTTFAVADLSQDGDLARIIAVAQADVE